MLVNICEKAYCLVRCFPEKTSSAETTSVPKILHYFVISHNQYPDLLPMHVRGDILKGNRIIREKNFNSIASHSVTALFSSPAPWFFTG